jgi:saccharopine dehydrogenase-like NADP-dependent oxidoreductase
MMIPSFSTKPIPYSVEKGGVNLGKLDPLRIWVKAISKVTSAQGYGVSETNMVEEFGKTMIPPTKQAQLLREGKIRDRAICFSVEVNGYKNGSFVRHIQYNNCTQAIAEKYLPWAAPAVYDTVGGLPLILILMIGRGQLSQRGVFSAGQLGISDRINRELRERGHDITEKIIRSK